MSEPNRYFVEFNGISDVNIIEAFGGSVRYDYNNMPELMSAELTSDQAEELIQHDAIKEITTVGKCGGSAQSYDWGYLDTEVYSRYRGIYSGSGVDVAILDTGLAYHEDLPTAYEWVDYVNGQSSQYDDHEHGTFCAGIIAGQDNSIGYVGVAPDSRLFIAKVLDNENRGYIDDLISGIDWAISQDVDIINFAIYTDAYEDTVVSACRRAYNAGIVVVACSGNGTINDFIAVSQVSCPAIDYSCVAVGSVNYNWDRSSFSNYGDGLDLVAPGEDVSSTTSQSWEYGVWSGTSFATAYVTGHLACLKEKYPSYSRSQLVNKLLSNTTYIGDSWEYGAGLVRAESTLPDIPSSAPVITARIEGGFSLSWGSSENVISYTLRYKNYDGIYHTVSNIVNTTYTLTGLLYGVTYSLSVRANNGSSSSDYTAENPGTTAPKSPGNLTNPATTFDTIDVRVADGMTGNWDYIRVYAYNNSISPAYKDVYKSDYDAGNKIVTWTNLSPELTYKFNAVTYFTVNSVQLESVYWSNDLYVTTSSRPSNFYWTTPKNSGNDFNLLAIEWNNLNNKINEFRNYKGLSDDIFSTAITNNTFLASQFNESRNSIADMSYSGLPSTKLGISDVVNTNDADDILASDLNSLVSCLNAIE